MINFLKKNAVLILASLAFVFSATSILENYFDKRANVVIFDRGAIEKEYETSLNKIAQKTEDKDSLKYLFEKKNLFFVNMMIFHLDQYEEKNNAIILERSTLFVPFSLLKTRYDITPIIISELKKDGAL